MSFDYDNYYNELLRNSIKYGMIKSSNEFWSMKDLDDYLLFQDAYYDKLHESCHTQGLYNCIAFNVVLTNAFKKKEDKGIEYPSVSLYQRNKKQYNQENNNIRNEKLTKENLQKKFMSRLSQCY